MTLAVEDITVTLAGRSVLDRVGFTLAAGEIVGIVGPNGAGKTTLLRAAAGVVPTTSGRVVVDGLPLAESDRRRLGRIIAYLPQERLVHWPLDVRTLVALGRLPHRTSPAGESAEDHAAIARALQALDLVPFAGRSVAQLSGGERARVLLARALAQEARYLLADEPADALDPAHQLALFALLRRMAAEGRGIALALHDLSAALRWCNRVLVLKGGRQMALGPVAEVLTPALLADAYGIRARIDRVDGLPIVSVIAPLT